MSEFDEWFTENMAGRPLYEYEIAERAWLASRAAIEIRLPERMKRDYINDYWGGAANGFNQCIDSCRIAIKLSGIEPKP